MPQNELKLPNLKSLLLTGAFVVGTAPVVLASPAAQNIGLSSDGSIVLTYGFDTAAGDYAYHFTSTATGAYVTVPMPNNASTLDLTGLSADGSTVIGYYQLANLPNIPGSTQSVAWTSDSGFVAVSSSGRSTFAEAVNANGSTVVGYTDDIIDQQAFYWTRSTGLNLLPGFADNASALAYLSYAFAVSADGSTVAGKAADGQYHAFVWKPGDAHITNIDDLYISSSASALSADGSAAAGTGDTGFSTNVFRWTSATGMVDIGNLGIETSTDLAAMSRDGNVLVGSSVTVAGDQHAYRYVASTATMSDLGTLGGTFSRANGLTADGSIVVGDATDVSETQYGFRWSQATGMLSVEQWLAASGVSLGSVTTHTADFVSNDGSIVVGQTSDNSTYIARVTTDGSSSGGGSGIINTSKYLPTVAAANNVAVQNGVYAADTIMFGAQGEPMRNLLAQGQKSIWGTVDGRYDNSQAADGGLGLGEFGFGYGIADGVTGRFSVGGTYTDQDLDAGGDVRERGFYLSPEVSADVGQNLYLTVGGYWARNRIDSHRGYLNAADRDYSDGDTDAQSWGGKVRVDWLNAATISDTAITPYAAISYARTRVDEFAETNGSFPVSYDETSDHATIGRLGGDFVHPLNDKLRILAKAEADYQFEDRSASTRGSIVGISDFDLAGEDLHHFWLRGGIGGEFDVATGTASVMVNATTQGQAPDFWVRSNWTVKF
jgi:probable HAF family extracellular repeat protein